MKNKLKHIKTYQVFEADAAAPATPPVAPAPATPGQPAVAPQAAAKPAVAKPAAPNAPTATGSVSPIVVYGYDASVNDPKLFAKLTYGSDNEVPKGVVKVPTLSFQVERICAEDAKANFKETLKSGQATAGINQSRLNPPAFHADINKNYTFKVTALAPKVGEHEFIGVWVINILANQKMGTEGTILNTGKVLAAFQNGGQQAGKFYQANGTTVEFQAHSAIIHAIYGPPIPPAKSTIPFKFDDSFEPNKTEIKVNDPKFQETLKRLIDELKANPTVKYKIVVTGNSSNVDTTYEGGNDKLAKDRATALGTAVKDAVIKAGIKWESQIVGTEAKSVVDGPAYKKGDPNNATPAEYKAHQFAKIELIPTTETVPQQ